MKKYRRKITQFAFILGLGACCLSEQSSAYNVPIPDLDCDGIYMASRIHDNDQGRGIRYEGGVYFIPQLQIAVYAHQLSRTPKPRNEWVYEGTTYVEEIDGEWYTRGFIVDTSIKGRVERFYRGLMAFYNFDPSKPNVILTKEIPTINCSYIVHEVVDQLPVGE